MNFIPTEPPSIFENPVGANVPGRMGAKVRINAVYFRSAASIPPGRVFGWFFGVRSLWALFCGCHLPPGVSHVSFTFSHHFCNILQQSFFCNSLIYRRLFRALKFCPFVPVCLMLHFHNTLQHFIFCKLLINNDLPTFRKNWLFASKCAEIGFL